ncbi:MAG: ABC transporter permease subunit [Candidatus Magasanikbacteria bacterium]|jgi:ABC-type nitrate/sulfonate/bicarbonate transport system permease component
MKRSKILYAIGPIAILAGWYFFAYYPTNFNILIPKPVQVMLSFKNFPQILMKSTIATLYTWSTGTLLGIILGILIGFICGYYQNLFKIIEIPLDFFRSIPSITLLPIVALFLGSGLTAKFFIVTFVTFLYVFIHTTYGIKYSRTSKQNLALAWRLNPWQNFREIIFYSSLPSIFAGIRTAITLGLIATISSEMTILGTAGLGKKIIDNMVIYNTTEMYEIIIIIGLIGYATNKLIVILENNVIHWKGH